MGGGKEGGDVGGERSGVLGAMGLWVYERKKRLAFGGFLGLDWIGLGWMIPSVDDTKCGRNVIWLMKVCILVVVNFTARSVF